jgi:protease-4
MRRSPLLAALISTFACGCGSPSLLITPVQNTSKVVETQVQPARGFSSDRIAIIGVEGLIANARSNGLLAPTENPLSLFTQQLETAERDARVKAVVLRVNSPGGTVTASDTIYEQVVRFKKRTGKPVVASAQELAASGAYYVSLSADKIVVQPTSVVGSIGVVFETFEFSGTMNKIGVRSDAIKSGQFKDIGSPFKPLLPDERKLMQAMVDEYFARFQTRVRTRRPGVADDVFKTATDGRVFSGQQAVDWGLADQTGLLSDAIDLARKLSNSPKAGAVIYTRPFGYSGSIYASATDPQPSAGVVRLELPDAVTPLPGGFYYLWEAGR